MWIASWDFCLLDLTSLYHTSIDRALFINFIISWVKIFPSRLSFCILYILGLQKDLLLLTFELFQKIFSHVKDKAHLWSVSGLIQRFNFCSNKLHGTYSLSLYFQFDHYWSLLTQYILKVVHPSVASFSCML